TILETEPVVDGELRLGGDGAPTAEIVCGVFAFESITAKTWLDRLPPVVISRGDGAGAGRRWRDQVGAALRDEARDPTTGGAPVVNGLLESLLVDAVGSDLTSSTAGDGFGAQL